MEKVLLAIDGVELSQGALEFACYVCRLTKSRLVGIFLENLVEEQRAEFKAPENLPYSDWPVEVESDEHRHKIELIEQNIANFKNRCCEEEIRCAVHRDRGVPNEELIHECRYADLLIIDPSTSFKRKFEGSPSDFARQALRYAECPVVVAPETFREIKEIAYAYDGSASALFSIKQFTYLFPEFKKLKLNILKVTETGQWQDLEKIKFSEWLRDHYAHVEYQGLSGEAENALFDYLIKRPNTFVVLGSFGRSTLSNLFKKSKAELLIETLPQPIFISHL